jgi:site-specific DNA-cytosine methylase
MNGPTCLDLFCGCGGFTLGIRESVFNPAVNHGEFAIINSQAGRAQIG